METTIQRVSAAKRLPLLAIGWAGYLDDGIGAVLVEVDSLLVLFAPARDLEQFCDPGIVLDSARKYCGIYDPQTSIVLVCFGAGNVGAAVTIITDREYSPVDAYNAGHLPSSYR